MVQLLLINLDFHFEMVDFLIKLHIEVTETEFQVEFNMFTYVKCLILKFKFIQNVLHK